jgi:hypothetical protein
MTINTDIRDPYALAAQEDRCAQRHSVRIEASLRPSGDRGFPVVVHDISVAGFSCEAVTGMPVGSLCWLTLPGLTGQQAEVIWNTGHMVGCAFANLLSPVVLDLVVARGHQRA